ncbi:MAG: ABC transporter substrate-binding protein, partial [Pseudomonadota bacterium]|nr:ABC transporter substrate-binding protein [Pseudomonadota bacterium]
NSVALQGDPRTGNSVMMAVYAAGVAEGGEAGADALNKGIGFFKGLKGNGNYVPVNGSAQNIAQGTTPIYFDWDYNLLAMRDKLAGNPPVEVVVPTDAVIAGVYVQAISAYAPHPNAAKLWMEYLYSDEGQLGWLAGYCHPIRFNDMADRGVIPQEMLDNLPPAENYAKAIFPTLEEQSAAKQAVADNWGSEMGVQ